MLKQPRYENIEVTPEIAKQWLPRNRNRRSLSKLTVADYANDMRLGAWTPEGEVSIKFDSEGFLVDGQHRLHAIILANVAIRMRVLFNAPDLVQKNTDRGRKRQTYEVLKLRFDGQAAERKVHAALKFLFMSNDGVKNSHRRPGLADLESMYTEWSRELDLIIPFVSKKKTCLEKAPIVVALLEYAKRDSTSAKLFVEALFTVDGGVQQARFLRDVLLRIGSLSSPSITEKIYGFTVAACRYHQMNKPIKQLKPLTWLSEIAAE